MNVILKSTETLITAILLTLNLQCPGSLLFANTPALVVYDDIFEMLQDSKMSSESPKRPSECIQQIFTIQQIVKGILDIWTNKGDINSVDHIFNDKNMVRESILFNSVFLPLSHIDTHTQRETKKPNTAWARTGDYPCFLLLCSYPKRQIFLVHFRMELI